MMCFSLLKQPIVSSKNEYTLCYFFLVTKKYAFWNAKNLKKNT